MPKSLATEIKVSISFSCADACSDASISSITNNPPVHKSFCSSFSFLNDNKANNICPMLS